MQNNSWNNFWQSFKNWVKYGVWQTEHQAYLNRKRIRLENLIEQQEKQIDVLSKNYEAKPDKRLKEARKLRTQIYSSEYHLSQLERQLDNIKLQLKLQ